MKEREYPTAIYCIKNEPFKWSSHFNVSVKRTNRHLLAIYTPLCPRNHKHPFVTETCPSVIKISLKEAASKSSTNSNSSLCLKQPFKGKRSARQSKPLTERLIITNDNDVSDEEVTPVYSK